MEITRIAFFALLPLLAACTLVDQRTFFPPAKPDGGQLAATRDQPRPALIIRIGSAQPDWHPAIAALVEQALARRPDAQFEIVAAIVPNGTASEQTRAASDIAQAISALGVPSRRLALALRTDEAGDIRVFVR